MAKKNAKKPPLPSSLTMQLFGPGMTAMHRAGLGGLACSLRYIEDQAKSLVDDQLPGGPWEDSKPPWRVESDQITLDFGEPEMAGKFLKRLFELSFQIVKGQGAIYLPGQYMHMPSIGVLADTQSAITLTFLQHGLTRKLAKTPKTIQIDSEGDGSKLISVEFKECESYKHQGGWEALVDSSGALKIKQIEVIGPINPGAVVRHVAFNSTTKIEDPVERMLPLYFAIVGTLALPVNRGVGVLIIPEVEDLTSFQVLRPLMSPRNARDCKIAGASDAAFQCQLRLKALKEMVVSRIPACTALLFRSTAWASQQKSRVDAIEIAKGDEKTLRIFEQAIKQFAPLVITSVAPKEKTQAKKTKVIKKKAKVTEGVAPSPEHFWSDSIVRPLVADNLARGQPWYRGFHDLMTKLDPVSRKPKRLKLSFEKAGLKYQSQLRTSHFRRVVQSGLWVRWCLRNATMVA